MFIDEDVFNYINNKLEDTDKILLEIEKYGLDNGVPIVMRDVRNLLQILVRLKNPKRILEIGTAIGYSSIVMAKSARNDVHIDTIECSYDMAMEAMKNIEKYGYKENINVIFGDAYEVLNSLSSKYDFIFIDAAKGQYDAYLRESKRVLNDDGIIIADNILFKGLVADFSYSKRKNRQIVNSLRKYIDDIIGDDNFANTVLSIGDGVSISLRRDI